MNHKDDTKFLEALESTEKLDAMLKHLVLMRRLSRIATILICLTLVLMCVFQLIGRGEIKIHGGVVLVAALNFSVALYFDLKIKMILIQRQTG